MTLFRKQHGYGDCPGCRMEGFVPIERSDAATLADMFCDDLAAKLERNPSITDVLADARQHLVHLILEEQRRWLP
jgi:hypothetical protein